MAQNMNVSVTLRLQDAFTAPVRSIMQQVQQLTRAAQQFNQALGGTGSRTSFGRMQSDVRALHNDVRQLANSFQQLNRATGSSSSGGVVQSQVANMRQLLQMQQQAIQNNARLASGSGSGRVPNVPGSGGILGRRGFSPNASLMDRAQYRGVNLAEQSLIAGALDLDRARTNLMILANPRPNAGNPDNPWHGVISPEIVTQIEREAVTLTQQFRSLNRAHVLDTFKELVTQFRTPDSAFALLPMMLAVQEWQVLQGSTVDQAREGNAKLLRAMGLSGRLVDNDGNLLINRQTGRPESLEFLENYIRARMIGGTDVTPDQIFQVMKYAKASGQMMNQDALLSMFIAMPDTRGSTFGVQLNQMRRQLTGGATKEAQAAQAAAGLTRGRIRQTTPGGPRKFVHEGTVDEELLNENPFEWFNKHILGPNGYLRRLGIDPMTATAAQMAPAFRRIFSNSNAEGLAFGIAVQQAEWREQVGNARRVNLTPEALQALAGQSTWYQLQSARSKLQDVMGSVAENFKLLLPALESVVSGFSKIAAFVDPKIGNPLAGLGMLGAGGIAAFITFRRAIAAMGPLTRMLLGGGAGFLLGGPAGALMGGMMLRGMGGGGAAAAGGGGAAAAAAAGAAGAAAGASWGRRFLTGARALTRLFLWGIPVQMALQVIEGWDTVKTRLLAIFQELREAAPTWLLGGGKGWNALGQNPQGLAAIPQNVEAYRQSWREWILGTDAGQWLYSRSQYPLLERIRHRRELGSMGIDLGSLEEDARLRAQVPGGSTVTVTGNPITINITAPAADPNAIGAAAGNAVQSGLRGAMGDLPPLP